MGGSAVPNDEEIARTFHSTQCLCGYRCGSMGEEWWALPGFLSCACSMVRENGRTVVDDVLYLKGENGEVESRLSKDLSSGCDGPRWVGEAHPH